MTAKDVSKMIFPNKLRLRKDLICLGYNWKKWESTNPGSIATTPKIENNSKPTQRNWLDLYNVYEQYKPGRHVQCSPIPRFMIPTGTLLRVLGTYLTGTPA